MFDQDLLDCSSRSWFDEVVWERCPTGSLGLGMVCRYLDNYNQPSLS